MSSRDSGTSYVLIHGHAFVSTTAAECDEVWCLRQSSGKSFTPGRVGISGISCWCRLSSLPIACMMLRCKDTAVERSRGILHDCQRSSRSGYEATLWTHTCVCMRCMIILVFESLSFSHMVSALAGIRRSRCITSSNAMAFHLARPQACTVHV